MADIRGKVALVTGASSGIGKICVMDLLSKGCRVYAAARRVQLMEDLEKAGAIVLPIDLTNDDSIKESVSRILETEESVDILINNAGYGSYGAFEDVPIDEGRRQFEVNIFGLTRVVQLVLPKMRENNYGKIVNISSIGGKMYTPFGGWYHATKHALEGLSDCLRLELSPFNIDVIIIEPGMIKTEWSEISAENLLKTSGNGAYSSEVQKTAAGLKKLYSSNITGPEVISRLIVKAVTANKPKTRYSAGSLSFISLFGRKVLSDRMFDRVISSIV